MRALSLAISISILLIPISMFSLGATVGTISRQQEIIVALTAMKDELIKENKQQKARIEELTRELAKTQNALASQMELLTLIEAELDGANARNKDLTERIRALEVHIAGMKIIQWSAPLLQLLPLGVLFAAHRIKLRPSMNVEVSENENIVTVRMTREQASEYSKWRRNERR